MSLLRRAQELEDISDEQLAQLVQQGSEAGDTWLAATETQRRKDMRDRYQAELAKQQAANPPDIMTQRMAELGGGIASADPNMGVAPDPSLQTGIAGPPQGGPPPMMADGGLIRGYQEGAGIDPDRYGGISTIRPPFYDEEMPWASYVGDIGRTVTEPEFYTDEEGVTRARTMERDLIDPDLRAEIEGVEIPDPLFGATSGHMGRPGRLTQQEVALRKAIRTLDRADARPERGPVPQSGKGARGAEIARERERNRAAEAQATVNEWIERDPGRTIGQARALFRDAPGGGAEVDGGYVPPKADPRLTPTQEARFQEEHDGMSSAEYYGLDPDSFSLTDAKPVSWADRDRNAPADPAQDEIQASIEAAFDATRQGGDPRLGSLAGIYNQGFGVVGDFQASQRESPADRAWYEEQRAATKRGLEMAEGIRTLDQKRLTEQERLLAKGLGISGDRLNELMREMDTPEEVESRRKSAGYGGLSRMFLNPDLAEGIAGVGESIRGVDKTLRAERKTALQAIHDERQKGFDFEDLKRKGIFDVKRRSETEYNAADIAVDNMEATILKAKADRGRAGEKEAMVGYLDLLKSQALQVGAWNNTMAQVDAEMRAAMAKNVLSDPSDWPNIDMFLTNMVNDEGLMGNEASAEFVERMEKLANLIRLSSIEQSVGE